MLSLILMGIELIEKLYEFAIGLYKYLYCIWQSFLFLISFIFCLNFHPLLAPGQLISHRLTHASFSGTLEPQVPSLILPWEVEHYCLRDPALPTPSKAWQFTWASGLRILGRSQRLPWGLLGNVILCHPQQRLMGADQASALFSLQGTGHWHPCPPPHWWWWEDVEGYRRPRGLGASYSWVPSPEEKRAGNLGSRKGVNAFLP